MSFQADILHSPQKFNMQIKIIFLYNMTLFQSSLIAGFILTAWFKNFFLTLHSVAQFLILPPKHLPKSMPASSDVIWALLSFELLKYLQVVVLS